MANTFLKRTLSVVMCAAMLVSVFAVSFTVSAVTETTSGETITTEWDFTKEDDYNDYRTNSEIITTLGEGTYITHGESGLSYSPGSDSNVKQPIMYLPIKAENQTAFEFSALKSDSNTNENQYIPGPSLVQVNGGTTYGFNFLITGNNLYLRSYYRKYGGDSGENGNCKADVPRGTVKTDDIYSADYSVTKDGEDGTGISNICYTAVVNFKDSSGTVILTKTVKFNINGTNPSGGDLNGYCNITGSSNKIQTRYGIAFGTAYQNVVRNTQVVTCAKLTTVDTTPTINADANVVLNDGVNLKITASGKNIDESTLALTVDGNAVELSDGAAIIPKFAHQMADKMKIVITAEGVNGDKVTKEIGDGSGYSIADNLANIYNSETTSDNDKTLIAKLANYGTAAQKYYNLSHSGYYTAFANDFLADTDENKTTSDTAYETLTNVASGGFIKSETTHFSNPFSVSLALSLQDNVKMVAKISGITLGADEKLYIKMDDAETELVNNGSGVYTAVFGEFSPKDYATDKTITLVVKNTSDNSEETSNEAKYSVGAYISRMAAKDTTSNELKTLLNTLAEYYSAAVATS